MLFWPLTGVAQGEASKSFALGSQNFEAPKGISGGIHNNIFALKTILKFVEICIAWT